MIILSIDPGKDKCGLAVMDNSSALLERKIVLRKELINQVHLLQGKYNIQKIIIGNKTYSKEISVELAKEKYEVEGIKEDFSTLEARKRYWKENKRIWPFSLLPDSLFFPPCPIDDYAAEIIAERYLKTRSD